MNKELKNRISTSVMITFLSLLCVIKGSYLFNIFIVLILCISLFEWLNVSYIKIIFSIGVFILFASILSTYYLRNSSLLFFLFVILISVSSDIGGFIFGKIIKGPKLTKISPNKTYAGTIGSFILSIISGLLYLNYFDHTLNISSNFNNLTIVSIIIFLTIINQLGDLIMSYYKRLKKIKNTGNILPGHGGLLDRIDGMIFTMLLSYPIYSLVLQ